MIAVPKLASLSADFRVIKTPVGQGKPLYLCAFHIMADAFFRLQFGPFQSYYLQHTFMPRTYLSSMGQMSCSSVTKIALFQHIATKDTEFHTDACDFGLEQHSLTFQQHSLPFQCQFIILEIKWQDLRRQLSVRNSLVELFGMTQIMQTRVLTSIGATQVHVTGCGLSGSPQSTFAVLRQ